MRKLQNFVGGAYRDAEDGPTAPLIDPSTGEAFAEAPVSGAADVDQALAVAAEAFTSWRRTTPSERSLALIRIADALEARAEDLVRAECENTGKPFQLTMDEEIPPMVDQIRFFAGAARNLEGLAAAEYMAGHTSFIRREPLGVCGAVTPWNYPMMMAVWKFAPGAGGREHHGAQALGHDPGHRAADGRDHGRAPPAGRLQRGVRRPRHRPGPGGARDARHGVGHRLGAGRHGGGRGRGADPQAGPPGARAARRRSSSSTTPTPPRRPRASPAPATSTPGRTARPPRGCWPGPGCTTTCWPRWSSRPRAPPSAAPTTRRPTTGRSTTPTSSSGCAASSSARRPTPRW